VARCDARRTALLRSGLPSPLSADTWPGEMGEYFVYANLDRAEFFDVGALGGPIKVDGVGRNLGARALGLLLLVRGFQTERHLVPRVGSWATGRIAAVGDYARGSLGDIATDAHDHIVQTFADISSAVIVMVFRHDGPAAVIPAAELDDTLFVRLAELALFHHVDDIEAGLDAGFGVDWRKTYAERRARVFTPTLPP
jgi:hypothetical protein